MPSPADFFREYSASIAATPHLETDLQKTLRDALVKFLFEQKLIGSIRHSRDKGGILTHNDWTIVWQEVILDGPQHVGSLVRQYVCIFFNGQGEVYMASNVLNLKDFTKKTLKNLYPIVDLYDVVICNKKPWL